MFTNAKAKPGAEDDLKDPVVQDGLHACARARCQTDALQQSQKLCGFAHGDWRLQHLADVGILTRQNATRLQQLLEKSSILLCAKCIIRQAQRWLLFICRHKALADDPWKAVSAHAAFCCIICCCCCCCYTTGPII